MCPGLIGVTLRRNLRRNRIVESTPITHGACYELRTVVEAYIVREGQAIQHRRRCRHRWSDPPGSPAPPSELVVHVASWNDVAPQPCRHDAQTPRTAHAGPKRHYACGSGSGVSRRDLLEHVDVDGLVGDQLLEPAFSAEELVAFGQLADDLIRRVSPALIRYHVVVDLPCPQTGRQSPTATGPPQRAHVSGAGGVARLTGLRAIESS